MAAGPQELYFYIPWKEWDDNECQGPSPHKVKQLSDMNITYVGTAWLYNFLKNDFLCKKTTRLPDKGIFFTNRFFLKDNYIPGRNVFPVCIASDNRRHPFAPLHLVFNPSSPMLRPSSILWKGFYVPPSPQPGIKPRDISRGDRFENIAFIGDPKNNLTDELKSEAWKNKLSEMGLKWHIVGDSERWTDYSYVDAIIAVRSFDRRRYLNKPAQKLYNAWAAGVPAILGRDSAYRAARKSEYDYIEVHSPEEAIAALKKLRDNSDLRHKMAENGRIRVEEVAPAKIMERYKYFINNIVVPEQENWRRVGKLRRLAFFALRYLSYKIEGGCIRIKNLLRSERSAT